MRRPLTRKDGCSTTLKTDCGRRRGPPACVVDGPAGPAASFGPAAPAAVPSVEPCGVISAPSAELPDADMASAQSCVTWSPSVSAMVSLSSGEV